MSQGGFWLNVGIKKLYVILILFFVIILPCSAYTELSKITVGNSSTGGLGSIPIGFHHQKGVCENVTYYVYDGYAWLEPALSLSGSHSGYIKNGVTIIGNYTAVWLSAGHSSYDSPFDMTLELTDTPPCSGVSDTWGIYSLDGLAVAMGGINLMLMRHGGSMDMHTYTSNNTQVALVTAGSYITSGVHTSYGGSSVISPVSDFVADPYSTLEQNELFDLLDNSTGTQPFINKYWEIVDDSNVIIQISTDLDFVNVSISGVGEYTVNHYVNNSAGGDWENKTNFIYIYDPASLHLQYTIRDGGGYFIENANIGIYEGVHGTWRNTTSPYGMGAFMDAGNIHQYPLIMGNTYTLRATKNGYSDGSWTGSLVSDWQIVNLTLTDIMGNNTNFIGVDCKDITTLNSISDCNIGIYDYDYAEWQNWTLASGTGYINSSGSSYQYPLEYEKVYLMYGGKSGYYRALDNVTMQYNYMYKTLYLTNYNPLSVQPLHFRVQLLDENDVPIYYGDIILFDEAHNVEDTIECQDYTCDLTVSGGGLYPLSKGYHYTLTGRKDGYYDAYWTGLLLEDYQVIRLHLTSESSSTIPTFPSYVPTYSVQIIPTVYPTVIPPLDIAAEWDSVVSGGVNITPFNTLEPVWNTSGNVNVTTIKQNINENNPLMMPFVALIDMTLGFALNLIYKIIMIPVSIMYQLLNPIYFVVAIMNQIVVALTNYGYLFTYVITTSIAQIPIKLQNAITITIVIGIYIQIINLKTGKRV